VSPIEETPYPDAPSNLASPLDDVAREEIGERLTHAIEMLPEMQRATFVLRYREELSVKETAAVLGCAEGTVKANGFHAIRRLRQILRTEEPEVMSNESTAL
jgi:RNA polymerase sigma factor (sigma-70 family)